MSSFNWYYVDVDGDPVTSDEIKPMLILPFCLCHDIVFQTSSISRMMKMCIKQKWAKVKILKSAAEEGAIVAHFRVWRRDECLAIPKVAHLDDKVSHFSHFVDGRRLCEDGEIGGGVKKGLWWGTCCCDVGLFWSLNTTRKLANGKARAV